MQLREEFILTVVPEEYNVKGVGLWNIAAHGQNRNYLLVIDFF